MKVQIIQLDPHDDLASARDKLAWAQGERLVLVWPAGTRILSRKLDLMLLQRQAAQQGAALGIVAHDPEVLDNAAALGLPVFRSASKLPEDAWKAVNGPLPVLPPRGPRPTIAAAPTVPSGAGAVARAGWLRWLVLGIVVTAFLASAAVILPSASIELHPSTRQQALDLDARLDPQAKSVTAAGPIPAQQVVERVAGSLRLPTTGSTQVAAQPAAGTIVFTNLTDAAVLIPPGTGVLPLGRPELRFKTSSELELPALKGATGSVGIVAVNPGSSGNLAPGAINAVDGPLGLQVSAINAEATSGGNESSRAAVSPSDQALILKQLTEQLLSQAAARIESQLAAGQILSSPSLRVVQTPKRIFDRQIGEVADSIGLDLELEVTGLVYTQAEVEQFAALALKRALPASLRPVPGSVRVEMLASADTSGHLALHATQQAYAPPDVATIRRLVHGQSLAEASRRLADLAGQEHPPDIRLRPGWWPRMPWLDVRIEVTLPW